MKYSCIIFSIVMNFLIYHGISIVKSFDRQSCRLNFRNVVNHIPKSIHKISSSIQDTIYALSSGPMVKCGIAVIRLSGPQSYYCVDRLIHPHDQYHSNRISTTESTMKTKIVKPLIPRKASLRKLICPKTNDILDQALVLWFPGPNSFTGEDVVELHLHGSRAVILGVFSALEYLDEELCRSKKVSIRPAERGEFTRRAFDTGKMDLTAVEGLADLLEADTSEQRKQALKQMDGYMLQVYERWRSELIRSLAHTEAVIDFGDDDRESDVSDDAMWAIVPRIEKLRDELQVHLKDGRKGEIVREGIRIALVGPPNAGKSSLINALAKRPLAIVSPIAGTTRDIVEVRMDLGGISCIICDTAGLREYSDDPIEKEGMKRARQAFRNAQLKIFVCDIRDIQDKKEGTSLLDNLLSESIEPMSEKTDDINEFTTSKVITVINKIDLIPNMNRNDVKVSLRQHSMDSDSSYLISCESGQGLTEFENGMTELIQSMFTSQSSSSSSNEGVLITRERHRRHLKQAIDHLDNFLDQSLSMDLAAEELRLAMQELGKVTGRVDVEEILDVLFRDFCIGK